MNVYKLTRHDMFMLSTACQKYIENPDMETWGEDTIHLLGPDLCLTLEFDDEELRDTLIAQGLDAKFKNWKPISESFARENFGKKDIDGWVYNSWIVRVPSTSFDIKENNVEVNIRYLYLLNPDYKKHLYLEVNDKKIKWNQ